VRQLFEPRLRGMSAATRGRTLAGAAGLAAPVVLPDVAGPPADADPSFGVLHGLCWLVAALAAQRPRLLAVDDLHWADSASVRFLEFLARSRSSTATTRGWWASASPRPPGSARPTRC